MLSGVDRLFKLESEDAVRWNKWEDVLTQSLAKLSR